MIFDASKSGSMYSRSMYVRHSCDAYGYARQMRVERADVAHATVRTGFASKLYARKSASAFAGSFGVAAAEAVAVAVGAAAADSPLTSELSLM